MKNRNKKRDNPRKSGFSEGIYFFPSSFAKTERRRYI